MTIEGFAKRLQETRKFMNMTQQHLADKLNVHQFTVSGWERGHREPSLGMLCKISKVLGCDPNYLLGFGE